MKNSFYVKIKYENGIWHVDYFYNTDLRTDTNTTYFPIDKIFEWCKEK